MLTAKELRDRLRIKPQRLAALLKQGLPCKGKGAKRRFDPATVAAWLKERGLARTAGGAADQVVVTIGEAALLLEVAPRTFASWLTDPTFPGKAGTPGRRDGYFPINAIRQWHLATHGATARGAQTDTEAAAAKRLRAQIQCDREQVELERELGTLLDRDEQERFLRRMIATTKAILEEAPDKVDSRLPGKLLGDVRKRIRKAVEEVVAEAMNALAEAAAGDQDELEDVPDDDHPHPPQP